MRCSSASDRHACRPSSNERGSALALTLVTTFVMLGLSGTYMFMSTFHQVAQVRDVHGSRARLAAEEGLHRAIKELRLDADLDGNGVGNVTVALADGRLIDVTATDLGGGLFELRSRGRYKGQIRAVSGLTERVAGASLSAAARAAITANSEITTSGNISVDGRDWNWDGTVLAGPGVFGISTTQAYSQQGSSATGGNGVAPSSPANPTTIEPFAIWANGIDEDGDTQIDEEAFDGQDNDGDGQIDEDIDSFPTSPDVMFGVPGGTLQAFCQAQGTYFATQTDYENYRLANGGNLPGGRVYYLGFDSWLPANLSETMNESPSILIHHNATGDAVMKNVHFQFKGLIIGDKVTHINGSFYLVGAFMSFANQAIGNNFGNGAAVIRYSSEALGGLPSLQSTNAVRMLSYHRITNY